MHFALLTFSLLAPCERKTEKAILTKNFLFFRDKHAPFPVITPEQLEVLKDVHTIKGSVMIQGLPSEITSLSFLRNLEKVYGRQPYPR